MNNSVREELARKSQVYEFDFEGGRLLESSTSINLNHKFESIPKYQISKITGNVF